MIDHWNHQSNVVLNVQVNDAQYYRGKLKPLAVVLKSIDGGWEKISKTTFQSSAASYLNKFHPANNYIIVGKKNQLIWIDSDVVRYFGKVWKFEKIKHFDETQKFEDNINAGMYLLLRKRFGIPNKTYLSDRYFSNRTYFHKDWFEWIKTEEEFKLDLLS